MSRRYKQLDLIFTRDFGLFTAEFWRDQLMAVEVRKVCGVGLREQVTWYDGKVERYFRIRSEVERLKRQVVRLPFKHQLFSASARQRFVNNVTKLRRLISTTNCGTHSGRVAAFRMSLDLMSQLYPWYMMSIFIAGPWAEDFKKFHGAKAVALIKQQYSNRVRSEGLLKEFSVFIRRILALELKTFGFKQRDASFVKFREGVEIIEHHNHPSSRELQLRGRGYVSSVRRLIVGKSFTTAVRTLGYSYSSPKVSVLTPLSGTSAYRAKPVRGTVHLVLTTDDIARFPRGGVLVTPMTAPDFLPAMRKALAIITDEGGVTCHAAIAARELKRPCIIGTKAATRMLKDGDLVEVDATRGIVKKLK